MDINPGKAEALARAHEMRLMRDQGVPVGSIADLFGYHPTSIETMLAWHERLYPEGTEYLADTTSVDAFIKEYFLGGRLASKPEPRKPEPPDNSGNPIIDLSEDDDEDEDEG